MFPSPMELLRSHLSRVRIPEPTNRIYKSECCISFDTPRSEGGLYVDLSSFLAFGKEYVGWNYEKTGNPVYLRIQQRPKPVPEDRPLKKPTLLAIGVDGGFDYQETDYEETHNIVILPDYVSLPFPSVELPEKVRLAVDAILIAEGAERKEQLAAWTAEKKKVSAYVMNLQQINSGVVVPPSGWKCCKCDKTDNLWLNLTDGMIFCGRRNWDGSGGNNHAIEHYNETKYPLAVKLGTITADLVGADVFSYPEDDTVEDPLLAQHLAFFGIDFSSLQKTEMTTAERELDQNTNFDWNRIQESGQEVEPLFGPGYTGLVNLGNSCYMASTIQVVFTTRAFISRYYEHQSLKMAFAMATSDPTLDLNMQLTKLAHGLLSGKYSVPIQEKQEGVPPRMFKTVIAANHPEFSSMRQQDALEFFLHFLDQVERVNSGKPELDPSRSFKFIIEERLQCPSGKVAYNKRSDYILSLSIPLHEATNKEQLEAFHKMKAERKLEAKDIDRDEIVRPRVPLEACLASFSAPEEVHDFYSTSLNAKTTAIKTANFATFPDYLVLHMRKFVMEEGWVPKKLDVYIDVPDVIDITHMRGKGLQPGEELLPETGPDGDVEHTHLVASEDIVSKLAAMGFNYLHCQKAAINTANAGVEEAMTWLLSHMNDPDIDDPISHRSDAMELQFVDETSVETLISFGFQEDVARKALKASGGDIEKATDWIFSHPEASASADTDATSSGMQAGDPGVPDGIGRYKLMALVSHIGTSTHCGHYVAHVHKDGRWVIFNDSKVGASVDPPKDMGYLYFYERIDG
ncbi:ubiquitin carboxyl-terminal hydrolase 14-like [Musa acuminata AAA Group]|uniref:Ubiquitin carboxyl-terminal hydrolase n=1 Tax=Musa acuminata subsp. malaccensis TaxID=214687 RepID=A0A804KE73_MUSAM|nr:PREDICTED: ubiquitin carboxyl-terminal hydrolase 14 [Musa acuminata subsp. malaccensis]